MTFAARLQQLGEYGVLVFLAGMPLCVNYFSETPFEFDKVMWMAGAVLYLFVLWIMQQGTFRAAWQQVMQGILSMKMFSVDFLLLLWLGITAVASVFSISGGDSVWGMDQRYMGLITLIAAAMAYWLMKPYLTRALFPRLALALSWSSVILVVYGILQRFGIDFPWMITFTIAKGSNIVRSYATLGHPNFLGLTLVFMLPFTLYVISRATSWWARGGYGLLVVGQLVVMLFTLSRSVWIGLVGCVVVLGISSLVVTRKKGIAIAAAVVLLGVIATTMILPTTRVRIWQKYAESTLYVRVQDFRFAWQSIQARPWLGNGPETFGILSAARPYTAEETAIDIGIADRAHNVFLDQWLNAGIFAVVVYCMWWARLTFLVWQGIRRRLLEFAVLGASLVGYFLWLQLNFDFSVSLVYFFAMSAMLEHLFSE